MPPMLPGHLAEAGGYYRPVDEEELTIRKENKKKWGLETMRLRNHVGGGKSVGEQSPASNP